MRSPTLVHATSTSEPTLVAYGQDGTGKPRASCCDAVSANLTAKAADPMKLHVLRIVAEEEKALAPHLAR